MLVDRFMAISGKTKEPIFQSIINYYVFTKYYILIQEVPLKSS